MGRPDVQTALTAARALELEGRLDAALIAFGEAFALSGQDAALAGDIGRLALRLGEYAIAEQLLTLYRAAEPGSLDGALNLAHALRELHRYDEALAVLSPMAQTQPWEVALWTAIGTILIQQGQPREALTFLEEALRLEPSDGGALYARANANADLCQHALAIADYAAAMAALSPADQDRVRTPLALSRLSLGDLDGGWADYQGRLSPHAARPVVFDIPGRPWPFDPDEAADALRGRSLLLVAEQGLGDEVMFANVVPDVLAALGEGGRLTLAVEARLVALLARAFPAARVIAHRTRTQNGVTVRQAPGADDGAFWAPLAAPLRRFRRRIADFPAAPYLTADPVRVAHWRRVLAARAGVKVGLLWKSLKLQGERLRQFAPFALWAPILRTPGVAFVNLQYGDCAEDLAYARAVLGIDIWQPPGVDLKNDLDDVAALTCALDLTVGFANATINLAGACGAPAWLITGPTAWPKLGTAGYPWYPQMRVFSSDTAGWESAMEAVAEALR